MSEIKTGGPAFPEAGLSGLPNGEFVHGQSGMTLRDYFAAKAMQAWLGSGEHNFMSKHTCAADAYAVSDAMLAARSKP